MKTIRLLTIVIAAIVLGSCSKEKDLYDPTAVTTMNAMKIFSSIDPEQDWNSSVSGVIKVTADADLNDVQKVQILTESPFFKNETLVVGEALASKGQTVTVDYDAPNVYTQLIAACVDSKGHYYIKPFKVGEEQLSFQTYAQTRGLTRSTVSYPDASKFKLEFTNSEWSYNAQRTWIADLAAETGEKAFTDWVKSKYIYLWQGAKWENERLWKPKDTSTDTEWTVVNGTVVRDASALSAEEKSTLEAIFKENLTRKDSKGTWGRKDNLEQIRNSEVVKFYNNHLTSDGSTPITIIPVQAASSEIANSHIYYYYYKVEDIPAGMSEQDYIKSLPKFKAIQCWHFMSAAGISNSGSEEFFKKYEYMLPYYGEPSTFADTPTTSEGLFTTDGKIYRIRNGQELDGQQYYITFLPMNQDEGMRPKYDDNAANVKDQLWQLFTDASGNMAFYNLGTKRFLVKRGNWETQYSAELSEVQSSLYKQELIDGEDYCYFWRYNNVNKQGLGTDLGGNYGVKTDKNKNGEKFNWYLDEYTGSKATAETVVTFENHPTTVAPSNIIIPKGYRIGFMLRKLKGSQDRKNGAIITANNNGCCYGFGGLNKEINNFPGHFGSGKTYFSMQDDDPRVAYFCVNGKTYITFEDGSDAQYSDLIIEVGGYDNTVLSKAPLGSEDKGSGIETDYLYDETEIDGAAYTLCFEDRSASADYDLNDVVFRCKRIGTSAKYKNWVELSLVAAGGIDDVVLHVNRSAELGSKGFDGMEVHQLFLVDDLTGQDRIVNTLPNKEIKTPLTYYYKLDDGMTIPQFLAQIYIENLTTGEKIDVARQGEAPMGIIVPFDFNYPMESRSIIDAYTSFKSWASRASQYKNWYIEDDETKVYPSIEVIRKIISNL